MSLFNSPIIKSVTGTQSLSALKNSSIFSSISSLTARLKKDEDGVAAIEFAFIAPVMLLIYFGMVEISLLVEVDRNVTQAASLVGDLTAQEEILTLDMMEDYINATIAVLNTDQDGSQTRLGVEISSYEATEDAGGNRVVNEIGYAQFGTPYDGGSVVVTPATPTTEEVLASAHYDPASINPTLLPVGSGIVVARINYEYRSPLQYFVKSQDLRETFFLKPRRSATVIFDNGNPADPSDMTCSMNERSANSGTFSIDCSAS